MDFYFDVKNLIPKFISGNSSEKSKLDGRK
jgi:hypothetical protein